MSSDGSISEVATPPPHVLVDAMPYWDSTPFGEPVLDPLFPSGMYWGDEADAVNCHQSQGFRLLAGCDLDESQRSVVVSKLNWCDADSSSSESCADDSDEKGNEDEVEDDHGDHNSFRRDAADRISSDRDRDDCSPVVDDDGDDDYEDEVPKWNRDDSFDDAFKNAKSKRRRRFLIRRKRAFKRNRHRTVTVDGADVPESRTDDVHQLHTTGFDFNPDFDPYVSIIHLSSLMHAAHSPGDTDALRRVRRLIQHAEQTPRGERTAAQVYLFKYWRSPAWATPPTPSRALPSPAYSSFPTPTTSPRSPLAPLPSSPSSTRFIPEIFVDASKLGIGFWFRERWLAWAFKFPRSNANIPRGSTNKIITSWAELIAVELGILALIAAGYDNTTVVVRSDNRGVVQKLVEGRWKATFGLQDVIERILAMCEDFRLVLKIIWVPSKDNPADAPSRRVYPPKDKMFSTPPPLPDHLSAVLWEVSE